ncbi:M23 family metallopeptidase [Shewanella yunxiaonensis]|uniref:M23 family metallopeptidase n=1 Tax=Shewanella yunxiaonensis TaxID=2829809 RepID=A0ABX7YX31_9GAMM|nr:M23 family metallopeptidase [Shewanella yunxiaonensis]
MGFRVQVLSTIRRGLVSAIILSLPVLAQAQNISQPAIKLIGKMEQGALLRGSVTPGSQLMLDGRAIQVSAEGNFAFGFERESPLNHTLSVTYPDGHVATQQLNIAERQYRISSVNGISKKIMEPDPKDVARAAEDSKMVKAARARTSEESGFASDFIWPLTGRISGVYGSQRIYNGKAGNPHYGVDIAAKTGTVVVAPAAGVVSLAVPDMFYSGGTMIIDHGYGVSSTFLHLSKLYLKPGTRVKQGQPVAEVGATGRANGPHLDWRINWYQMRLDAATVVPAMKDALKTAQN